MHRLLILLTLAVLPGCTPTTESVPTDKSAPTGKRAPANNPVVVIDTSEGSIKVELFEEQAPGTVKNFLGYVDDKFYDGLIFHRVIKNFMIQGGGFSPDFKNIVKPEDMRKYEKKTKDPIRNEANNGLSNVRGTIAMARTNDPHSATSQFFINVEDNTDSLDPQARSAGYAVFGKVVEGMDVVDKIRAVKTKVLIDDPFNGVKDVPEENVVIKSIRRLKN